MTRLERAVSRVGFAVAAAARLGAARLGAAALGAAALGAAALSAGCGGDAVEPELGGDVGGTAGSETSRRRDDGVQIEGLLGTLSEDEINRGLEPRMDQLLACFERRYEDLEVLGGRIQFAFRVGTDGRVRWVYARASTVGDRDTERCLLEVTAGARFPRPHGGEAEFSWPIELDPPEDVRPPFQWDAARTAAVVSERGAEVRASCGVTSPLVVTAYVAPAGEVLAAGASSADQVSPGVLDCVSQALRSWQMPDPGSYPAKVTFELR